jgi:drug/metabolite transporter (DMT)-like permease
MIAVSGGNPEDQNVAGRTTVMAERDSRPAALWMLWGALCFAAMGAMTHALGPRCGWLVVALVRALFMYVSIVAVARVAGVPLVVWRPPVLWVRSLAGTSSLFCSFYALTRLPVAEVLTLTNTYPLWILVMSWVAFGERPSPRDLLAVACAVVGVALIERPRLGLDQTAALIALLSAFCAAVAMIGLHRLKGVDPRAVVAHFAGVASVSAAAILAWWTMAANLSPVSDLPTPAELSPSLATIGLLGGVGLTGTIGQVFLTKAYGAGVPSEVAVISLTQVVFGLLFDVLFWGRTMPVTALLGLVLIVAPTAWLTSRSRAGDS